MRNLFFTLCMLLAFGVNTFASELMVYSSRAEHLIKPLFEEFTKETGIKVRYVTDKDGALIEKLKVEGSRTPADVLMTVDAGNLWLAAKENLLQPVKSKTLESAIPEHLRDTNNLWFGLTIRARTIIYNSDKVKPSELSTYADLANPKWEGRLCLRTSKKVYNQSMVAMFIAEQGANKTEEILLGWVDNLATAPLSSDTKVIEAIEMGKCDVGIINSYYLGRYLEKSPNSKVKLFWADQNGNGVHVNISGAGVTKYAKNKENAVKLLEWLVSDKAQQMYAEMNFEYPVKKGVPLNSLLNSWGSFKQNKTNLSFAGELQGVAIRLMDKVGYK